MRAFLARHGGLNRHIGDVHNARVGMKEEGPETYDCACKGVSVRAEADASVPSEDLDLRVVSGNVKSCIRKRVTLYVIDIDSKL